ncbi:WD40-repeat-containing domain protein [Piptocephalis cylindrospora]|uniref:WD40-repeat-containing domain protein n=1 Tax=Piptocephalis cylindrospora TaxID=1907219 RepID=A0A4P9Y833_9FUNG|nr:WD40-repeat-containing domain protein [Piptocephalis cylindrospora]|eukprot:RKP14461.1 WD40-repeat-containing domain protein [Piptocephalis cylindrospora]
MNLELLPPHPQNYPEAITGTLHEGEEDGEEEGQQDSPDAVRLCFNRRGTHVAIGHDRGACHIWDMLTGRVVVRLDGHATSVSSLSWSRDSRLLLTTGEDGGCILWDLTKPGGFRRGTFLFPAPILTASIHPRDSSLARASSAHSMHGKRQGGIENPVDPSALSCGPGESREDSVTYAVFTHQGDSIVMGSRLGRVVILRTEDQSVMMVERVVSAAIRHIRVSRQGGEILLNAMDKTMRLLAWSKESKTLETRFRFQEHVDRQQWNQCGFTPDGEYVFGGSAHLAEHNVFLYDRKGGNLVKMLEGPRETVIDIAWHPYVAQMLTVSSAGRVYIWTIEREESWTAYAPGFQELEENKMYHEPEDEFDLVMLDSGSRTQVKGGGCEVVPVAEARAKEEAARERERGMGVGQRILDVDTVERTFLYGDDSSGDEDEEGAFHFPIDSTLR